jgi:hypothetical protein
MLWGVICNICYNWDGNCKFYSFDMQLASTPIIYGYFMQLTQKGIIVGRKKFASRKHLYPLASLHFLTRK